MLLRKMAYYCMSGDQLLERTKRNKERILVETDAKKIKKIVESEIDLLDVMTRKYTLNKDRKQFVKESKEKLTRTIHQL